MDRPSPAAIDRAPSVRTALESLASDGPVTAAISKGDGGASLPELFRSISTPPVVAARVEPAVDAMKKGAESAKKVAIVPWKLWKAEWGAELVKTFKQNAPASVLADLADVEAWWVKERVLRRDLASIQRMQLASLGSKELKL